MPPHGAQGLDIAEEWCRDCGNERKGEREETNDYNSHSHAASLKVAVVRGVSVLITPWRPVYFWRFRNSSIALRISQETGRSSRTEIFSNFSNCSGLSRTAVSFFLTLYSV